MAPNRCVCPYGFTGAQCERGKVPHCRIFVTHSFVTHIPAEVGWISKPHTLLFGEKCGQMLDRCCFYDWDK